MSVCVPSIEGYQDNDQTTSCLNKTPGPDFTDDFQTSCLRKTLILDQHFGGKCNLARYSVLRNSKKWLGLVSSCRQTLHVEHLSTLTFSWLDIGVSLWLSFHPILFAEIILSSWEGMLTKTLPYWGPYIRKRGYRGVCLCVCLCLPWVHLFGAELCVQPDLLTSHVIYWTGPISCQQWSRSFSLSELYQTYTQTQQKNSLEGSGSATVVFLFSW